MLTYCVMGRIAYPEGSISKIQDRSVCVCLTRIVSHVETISFAVDGATVAECRAKFHVEHWLVR